MRKKSEELKMGVFTIAKMNFSEQLYSSVVVLQFVPTLNLANKPYATPEWFLYHTGVVIKWVIQLS
jgi:hypothetical protein